MKQYLSLLLFAGIISCSNPTTQQQQPAAGGKTDSTYQWTKLLDSADWKKSYNFQMFNVRDTLWVFHPDGNWFSADGVHWQKSVLPNAIYNLAFLKNIPFKGAVYGLGHFEGNIEKFILRPEIYRTTDMRHWDTLSTTSNLPVRFFYDPFVFADKVWIIGGEDKNKKYADAWSSADGVNWVKEKDSLPFGARSGSKVVLFRDKLFLLNNDVWSSADALHWQRVTDALVKGQETFGFTALVFDDKIWLIGCNRDGQFLSNVLYSDNGKDWKTLNAPWTPRGGIAAAVFKNKIYMTGGKYGGTPNEPDFRYSNDVWILEKINK